MNSDRRRLISAGMILGTGLGGFFDGFLFHQLLQSHNMLSAKYPVRELDYRALVINLEINMFWDGVFHAFCWAMTLLGLALLWRTVKSANGTLSTRVFIGSLAAGWGAFQLIEGIINHHVLHLHHVMETPNHLLADLMFLASGIILLAVGVFLMGTAKQEPVETRLSKDSH